MSERASGVRRGRLRASAWLVIMVGLQASCGSDEGAERPAAATPEPARAQARGAQVPAPPAQDVPGAAARTAGGEVPADTVPLGSRFAPRKLEIPQVPPGRSASFQVDGERRGWMARLPEYSRMHLLTPTFGKDHVYLGGGFSSTKFYALNAKTGAVDWVTMANDGGPTAAIIDDDRVLFNTESCTLFVVDAETGRLRWKRWLGDPLMGQAAAAGGRVFSGHIRNGGGYGMTAMDLDDGHVLWTRNISADVMNAPVLDDESLFFTTMDGVVWRMDQRTGRLRWHQRLHATSAPWLDGDVLHVARRQVVRSDDGRRLKEQSVVVSADDGEVVRELDAVDAPYVAGRPDAGGTQAGWAYEGSRPTIVAGRAYQAIGNEVQSRNARTGELLWRRRYTDQTRSRPASPPAVAGSQLVFGTEDGELYGLDIDTGMTTFAYDVGEPIAAQPSVAQGWVYASTTRGGVVGIELADSTIDGWHMWGGNAKHNGPVASAETAQELAHSTSSDVDEPTEGQLRLNDDPHPGELGGFPLKGTEVSARVSGFVARVRVEQTFQNPYERAVEAVYLFPLPDDAAVDEMELHAGTRVVRGEIHRREQARRIYRAARRRGRLASLLEQERPNLFRQSVANIRPGDEVKVVLEYTQVLPYEDGSYRFVYPMVAGPRYTPAAEEEDDDDEAAEEGSDVRQVALPPGQRRRDRVKVTLTADMGGTLHDVTSPTHEIEVERRGTSGAEIRLASVAPDEDLDVRLKVAGDEPGVGVVASPPGEGDEEGFVTLLMHPRLEVPEAQVQKRELVFVVDSSSSMHGRPMELAKAAMKRALDGMRDGDVFRVVSFSDGAQALSDEPLAATEANVHRAEQWVDGLTALGQTKMVEGVRAALDPPEDPDRMRVVLLVTDGYIGNEAEVFRATNDRLGNARVFAFGVGSAVNRYLLTRLAEVGRGEAQVVTLDESPEEAADVFHERIATPYLTDIQVDWGDLEVSDVYPRRVPDLFGDRPLVVHGRYGTGTTEGTVTVRGRIAGRAFEREVHVSLPGTDAEPKREVQSIWARTAIRDRMLAMALRPTDALREEIVDLGLRYGLVTQWTSFVAVDEGYRTDNEGDPDRVDQPSALPTGVDYGGEARVQAGGGHALGASASGVMGAMGSMGYGSGVGTAYGYGGLGLTGTGRGGGGGVGEGTIGLGALGQPVAEAEPAEVASEHASPPRLAARRATVAGSFDRSRVTAAMGEARERIRAAYESTLRSDPDVAGRIVVQFTIGPDGSVTSAQATTDTLGDAALVSRILAIIREMSFDPPAGGGSVTVSYPFVFAPDG